MVKTQKMQWFFSKYILFTKQNKTVFWGEMVINSRKRYFHIDENASSEQIYALLDIESAHEDDNQSKKKEKNKKEELRMWNERVKVTKQEEC